MKSPTYGDEGEGIDVIGIIPARGGSKVVPKKNIRTLAGKPLIAYTIEAAQKSEKLDGFIISTDSEEIAEVAREYGAEVPFLRPPEFARDDTPDKPVFQHALKWLKENKNIEPKIVVNLRPTTPFKTPKIIDDVVSLLESSSADSVRTVTKVEGVHHPYWMFIKDTNGRAKPFYPGIQLGKYSVRQLLPPVFRLNGVVDAMRAEIILHHDTLYGEDMRILEIPEEFSIDIDTEFDFKICEILMRR